MITYTELYEYLRKEKYSEKLQPLPKNFIEQVVGYLNEKKEMAEKKDEFFSEAVIKTKKQFENAISIFKELILSRKQKLLNLAFIASETGISKRDFENMLYFEKELFDEIMTALSETEKKIASELNGQRDKEKKNKLILFLQNVDAFVGLDGESLGPFEKETIANLPAKIADILVQDKKAEYVGEG